MKYSAVFLLFILAGCTSLNKPNSNALRFQRPGRNIATTEKPQSGFSQRAMQLFNRGVTPSKAELNIKWACFYSEDDHITLTTDYAPNMKDGQPHFATFGFDEARVNVPFIERNSAQVAESTTNDGKIFTAYKVVRTGKMKRMIIEDSADFASWQNANVKSKVTGFTPILYLICLDENRFLPGLLE